MTSQLPAQVLELLAGRELTLAVAESLTGGLLAALVTDVPGASRVFRGGVVSYATEVKVSTLGVSESVVAEHGVVSAPCAAAMAAGVRDRLGADIGLSTTGVAGPDTQDGHPVGTVFIAISTAVGVTTRELALAGGRDQIRRDTCAAALHLVLSELDTSAS